MGPVVVPFPPASPPCPCGFLVVVGSAPPLAEAVAVVTQLLLRGSSRALVLIFSTTVHVYNCIYYGRAARILKFLCQCSTLCLPFCCATGGTAHDVMLL